MGDLLQKTWGGTICQLSELLANKSITANKSHGKQKRRSREITNNIGTVIRNDNTYFSVSEIAALNKYVFECILNNRLYNKSQCQLE